MGGLKFEKQYELDSIEYSKRTARIVDAEGNIIFEQKDVMAPSQWSDQAVAIFASKYFNGKLDSPERENSVFDVMDRIVNTITDWGNEDGYFDTPSDASNFRSDLKFVLLNQMGSFASPYYFNVGIKENPLIGSCFINNVEDDIESITDLFKTEARIFKGGGGSGTNLSKIRGSNEGLSDGGQSSGPVSFMKAYDSFAGEMKSAGVKRRAALLRCLDVDHPDIMKFITCKVKEERKGKDLLSLGYSGGLDGEANSSLAFQNANNAVRLSDAFMNAVENDEEWELINRVDGESDCTIPARDILMEIAKSSWECGDPGIQYSDTIEYKNPLNHETRPIVSSNPCFSGCTKLYTRSGYISIRHLIHAPFEILCYDGRYRKSTAFKSGVKDTYKVQLAIGYCLYITKDHKLLCDYPKDENFYNPGKLTFDTVQNLLGKEVCYYNHENRICKSNIKSIEYLCTEDVYDFTEPVTHTGVANGIIVHNCGEIYGNYTQCNLAGANLVKIFEYDNIDDSFVTFYNTLLHVIRLFVTAQDISISFSAYPYEELEKYTKAERPIGFGLSNIGGLLMSLCIPYDSHNAREIIADIVNFTTLIAYDQSSDIAKWLGECDYDRSNLLSNLESFRKSGSEVSLDTLISNVKEYGVRNCNVTCMQPFGTCGLIMDCDSTSLEPIFSLVKSKKLVGGGTLNTISTSIESALHKLPYLNQSEIDDILVYVKTNGEIVGAPHLEEDDYEVFETALSSHPEQCIDVDGHVDMVATVQRNITNGISKTINVPNETTVEELYQLYIDAWRKGLKSIIIYRDGSKTVQPMTTVSKNKSVVSEDIVNDYSDIIRSLEEELKLKDNPKRKCLPDERSAINHKFNIGTHEGYLNVGLFEDGTPGEIFITMSKAGSAIAGLVDAFSISISLGLQYGVPLSAMVEKFSHMRFEPSGFTNHSDIHMAKSIVDYIFRWMENKFLNESKVIIKEEEIKNTFPEKIRMSIENPDAVNEVKIIHSGEICVECGSEMQRSGACWQCQCGAHTGCG